MDGNQQQPRTRNCEGRDRLRDAEDRALASKPQEFAVAAFDVDGKVRIELRTLDRESIISPCEGVLGRVTQLGIWTAL